MFGKNFGKIELLLINMLSYVSLYFLLNSLNKINLIYLFLPLMFFSLVLIYKISSNINFVNKKDPQSSIIIISDHGHKFPFTYDILTLVKINKECQQNVPNKLNIPNGIRLILGCTVGQKIKLLFLR